MNAFGQKKTGRCTKFRLRTTPRFHAYVVLLQMISELVPQRKSLLNSFVETSVFLIKSMLIL